MSDFITHEAVEAAYTAMGEFQHGNTYDPNKTAHRTGWSYDQLVEGIRAAAPILFEVLADKLDDMNLVPEESDAATVRQFADELRGTNG